jgi:hypothetical protein
MVQSAYKCGDASGRPGISSEFATDKRLRDHRVDLGGVKGALRMIDQRVREGEHDMLVLLDECHSPRNPIAVSSEPA